MTPGLAQLVPDDTLGAESSLVNSNSLIQGLPAEVISGGATRGSNLFHSFAEFNVGPGQRVYFANPTGIANILTRVTGSHSSQIDGLLGVTGDASLFLLNPNGVIFGPNARLDISGSFTASTAASFTFTNGSEFTAIPTGNDLLTVSVPLGVQFNDQPNGDITNNGYLAVGGGQSLTLLGDTVLSSGSLIAPGGNVQLLGNRVALIDEAIADVTSATGGGNIQIGGDYQGAATVPTADYTFVGEAVKIHADAIAEGDGGRVIVWANGATRFLGSITAQGGTQNGNGGFVEVSGHQHLDFQGDVSTSALSGRAGTLLLDPTNITIINGSTPAPTNAQDGLWAFGEDAGDQTIGADHLSTLLNSNSVTLQATDRITVNASVSASSNRNLTLQANEIQVNANLRQSGGGNIVLTTPQTEGNFVRIAGARIDTDVPFNSMQEGGNIRITTHDLMIQDGSVVSASTRGNASSGQVQLNATGLIRIAGSGTRVRSEVNSGAQGDSGGVQINTHDLLVTDRAWISSDTLSTTGAGGNSGLIRLVGK